MNVELAKALLAVQAEAPSLQRDGINPHFRSSYVTLESLMGSILPLLNKHGILLVQSPEGGCLITHLIHAETGQDIAAETPLMLTKDDPQGQGSAITYARRYALMSMLGLVADADDDGNAARPATTGVTYDTAPAPVFDPAKNLLPTAIVVRAEEDATSLRQGQRDLDPSQDWAAIEDFLCQHLFGRPYADLNGGQKREFYTRLANAVVKADGGGFPPPDTADIIEAYSWAFNGVVLALSGPEETFEAAEEEMAQEAAAAAEADE